MPPFESRAVAPASPASPAGGSDIAVEPESLRAAAHQLRQAADALPVAARRLRVALSDAAAAAGSARCSPALAEHADRTCAAIGALAERVLVMARALDAGAVSYRSADAEAVRCASALPSQRQPL